MTDPQPIYYFALGLMIGFAVRHLIGQWLTWRDR